MLCIEWSVSIRNLADLFKVPYMAIQTLIAKISLRHALVSCEVISLTDVGHSDVLSADSESGLCRRQLTVANRSHHNGQGSLCYSEETRNQFSIKF